MLFVKDHMKTAVVADLHLGFEFELSKAGINLPSQTPKLRDRLMKALDRMKAERLIILGDLKHNIPNISLQEWRDIPLFLDSLKAKVKEIQIILGNHDGGMANFKSEVKIISSRGMVIGAKEKVGLFHGHAWPSPNLFEADCWVMGHNHPAIQFRGFFGFRTLQPMWVKAPLQRKKLIRAFLRYRGIKAEKKNPETLLKERYGVEARVSKLIVMPTFNDLLVGLPFNVRTQKELLGPILRSGGISINRAEVFMVDGTFLGTLRDLRKLT